MRGRGVREPVSTDGQMRAPRTNARDEDVATPDGSGALAGVPEEVVAFIRYCYQRRRIGWPELYDEMCGVAARAEFRDMDYERLEALGVRFSLGEMGRLAALSQQVVADERRRRTPGVPRGADEALRFEVTAVPR
jgi:hypothetical protein